MIYSSGITEEYSYNKNNMLTSLVNTKGSERLSEYSYQYNDAGKISSKVDNKGTTSYTYDSLNRLKTVTEPTKTTSYLYDKSGNRTQETINQNGKTYIKTYNYQDGLNLLNSVETAEGNTIIGTRSYSYDKTGNMINERVTAKSVILPQGANLTINEILENPNKIEGNISKATDNEVVARAVKELTMGQIRNTLEATETNIKYEYDIFNDMTKATDLNTNKTLVENKYNAEGLRVSKESNGEKTGYIYEGENPIVELNLNSAGTKATVKASNEYVGDTVISKNIGNEKYNYLYNGHGDVVNLIDNKGTIKNTYYYDAFGVVEESVENVDHNFKYSKYEYDKETGKYYLKSRMYDPTTARFMQEDTYRGKTNDPLSLNLYTYCVNEPLTYYDPDGHSPISTFANWVGKGVNFLFNKTNLGSNISKLVSSGTGYEYLALSSFTPSMMFMSMMNLTFMDNSHFSKITSGIESVKSALAPLDWRSIGHLTLDIMGMLPGIGEGFDLINAAWYYSEGNYKDAAYSAMAMVPLAGSAAIAGGRVGYKLAKAGIEVASNTRAISKAVDITKTAVEKTSFIIKNAPDIFARAKEIRSISKGVGVSSTLGYDVSRISDSLIQGTKELLRDSKKIDFYVGPEGDIATDILEYDLYKAAELARDNLIRNTPGAKKKATAVGAYDILNGNIEADFAGDIPYNIDDILLERANDIGGINTKGLTSKNIVGACAEFRSANTLLTKNSKIQNIRFTKAIRPRSIDKGVKIVSPCENCLNIFIDAFKK